MNSGVAAETPDLHGAYPRLSDEQIDRLSAHSERRPTQRGDLLFEEGQRVHEFFVILAGKVAVVEGYGGPEEQTLRVHGAGRFLGELGLLAGQASPLTAVVVEPGEVLAVPVDWLREVVLQDPVLGDLILRAYLVRRSLLIGLGVGFRLVGSCYSPDARRLREFAARNRLPYRWTDVEQDEQAEELLRRFGVAPSETPVIILHGNVVLRNPSNAELAAALGLGHSTPENVSCDLAVVGAGPAGLAAAVYGASEGLTTTVLEGLAAGGQAGTSSRIENYLGFPAGISGAELAERAVLQADKFGAQINVPATAKALTVRDGHYAISVEGRTDVTCRAVVLATGVHYRRLQVPGIEPFEGAGVYYAATLHEARMCRSDPVAVVGGGNSAGQATVFLADHTECVYLVVREADLGENMSRYLVEQVEHHPRVEVLMHSEVRRVNGTGRLDSLIVEDNQDGTRRTVPARALFVFIGATPCTQWLGDAIALDERGSILTGSDAMRATDLWQHVGRPPHFLETSLPGVFAAGDVRSGSIKRVAAAVGEGAMAVRLVHEHVDRPTGSTRQQRVSPPQAASS